MAISRSTLGKRIINFSGLMVIGIGVYFFVPQSCWVQIVAWMASVGLMTAVNFVIHSDFKFALLALAVLWLTGIILQWPKAIGPLFSSES